MKPRAPLPPRSAPLKRSRIKPGNTPIKARGRPRFKHSGQPDETYREFIRSCACLLRGRDPDYACPLGVLGAEAAHVRSRGAGGCDRGNLVPLCCYHHAKQHAIGIKSFQKKYGVDLGALARAYAQQYKGAT